jgi:hypothetical protein
VTRNTYQQKNSVSKRKLGKIRVILQPENFQLIDTISFFLCKSINLGVCLNLFKLLETKRGDG